MAETYEGVGSTITFGTSAQVFNIEAITVPGFSRERIDVSHLGLTAWKTQILAKLKSVPDFTVTVQADYEDLYDTFADNELITITLPDSDGSIAVWGAVAETANGDLVIDDKPTAELTISVSNRNGSAVETGPAFST
jgi:hypothetical protein